MYRESKEKTQSTSIWDVQENIKGWSNDWEKVKKNKEVVSSIF